MHFVKSVHVWLHKYLHLPKVIDMYTIKWMSYSICKLYLKVDTKNKLNMYKVLLIQKEYISLPVE